MLALMKDLMSNNLGTNHRYLGHEKLLVGLIETPLETDPNKKVMHTKVIKTWTC